MIRRTIDELEKRLLESNVNGEADADLEESAQKRSFNDYKESGDVINKTEPTEGSAGSIKARDETEETLLKLGAGAMNLSVFDRILGRLNDKVNDTGNDHVTL